MEVTKKKKQTVGKYRVNLSLPLSYQYANDMSNSSSEYNIFQLCSTPELKQQLPTEIQQIQTHVLKKFDSF